MDEDTQTTPAAHVALTDTGEIAYVVIGGFCVPGPRIAYMEREKTGVRIHFQPPYTETPHGGGTLSVYVPNVGESVWWRLQGKG